VMNALRSKGETLGNQSPMSPRPWLSGGRICALMQLVEQAEAQTESVPSGTEAKL